MPLDPQFQALLAHVPPGPSATEVPPQEFRAYVRTTSLAFPKLDVPLTWQDRSIPGPAGPLGIRIYTPSDAGPHPLVVFFHSGGWIVGDLDTQDMIARALCHGVQAVVVSVDYRLAPEHRFPAAIDDASAATRWAAANAASLGADARRLAVVGESAGGVIACAVALRARDEGGPALAAQVNYYGSCNYPSQPTPSSVEFAQGPIVRTDEVAYFWDQYLADPAREQHHPWASPMRAKDHHRLPPAFIATAELDPSRDDAEAYAAKLAAAGVTVEQRRYAGMPHGFMTYLGVVTGARRAFDESAEWLRARLA